MGSACLLKDQMDRHLAWDHRDQSLQNRAEDDARSAQIAPAYEEVVSDVPVPVVAGIVRTVV